MTRKPGMRGGRVWHTVAILLGAATGLAMQDSTPLDPVLEELVLQAEALEPLVESDAARALLAAVKRLPPAEPTRIYRAAGGYLAPAYTRAEYEALDESERDNLQEVSVDTRLWYHTFYGSPLASLRAYDLAARHGLDSFANKRVLDFGFGSIGQLQLLTTCGADVVGAEVMPALRALYDPVTRKDAHPKLVFGRWPADKTVIDAVGSGFDLFISKNTIKRGYINPPVEVDPGYLLDFGVEQQMFLERLHAVLRPGGIAMFYNLGGKPAGEGEAYRPPTDIASPWSRATYAAAGFEVLVLDQDDTEAARAYGFALGWEDSMDLATSLFANVTVLRRPE
jgi:hypothetical protein